MATPNSNCFSWLKKNAITAPIIKYIYHDTSENLRLLKFTDKGIKITGHFNH